MHDSSAVNMKEMEELSKIQYSIGELLKKKQDDKMAQSVEVKFAQTLNQLTSKENDRAPVEPPPPQNALLGKLSRHLGAVTHQKVDTQSREVYKQIKALELHSRAIVS